MEPTSPAEAPPSADLRARILAAARAEPAPTRRAWRWRTAATVLVGLAAMAAVFFAIGGVRVTGRPLELVLATALGALVIAGLALWVAFGRGGSMLGRGPRTLIWMVVAVPLVLFAWKTGASATCEADAWWPERPGFRCLLWSLLMGVALLSALLLARRRTVPARPGLVGAALGVAVGACAWVFTDLWCPVGHAAHLLLGHVLPIVVLGGLGAIGGGWLLPPRR